MGGRDSKIAQVLAHSNASATCPIPLCKENAGKHTLSLKVKDSSFIGALHSVKGLETELRN